jgi:RHS repeat-associated protein
LGSPRAISDENGNVIKAIAYDSYGSVISDSNPAFTIPFGFAGGLQDSDTRLIRFGFRDYDPQAGRWTARDPIGFHGGLNHYAYAENAPTSRIDLNGLKTVDTTRDAIRHYLSGQGGSVALGPLTQSAIKNSADQQYRSERITSGQTPSTSGQYGVDVESSVYHVGDTPILYSTVCSGGTCVAIYVSQGDGFWDPIYSSDGVGPGGEFLGSPFSYEPFIWTEEFIDPSYMSCGR